MELRQLKYFLAVADSRSFVGAAGALFVSRQAVSKAVSQLEAELGVALFDRDNRSVHLNGYGQAFLHRAERVLAEMDEAVTEIQDMKSGEAGRIQIASAFLLDTPGQLAEFVGKFYFDHPRIHVHVFYQEVPSMADMLKARRVDFALTDEDFPRWAQYHLATCEKRELLGHSSHLLYICRKL